MADTWDPEQYEKFSDHRQRPFAELMSRVAASTPEIVGHLGCGSGAHTPALAVPWPPARARGIAASHDAPPARPRQARLQPCRFRARPHRQARKGRSPSRSSLQGVIVMCKTKLKPVLQAKPLLDRLRYLPQMFSKD